jgi:thiosulfate/3-mercaptopyruvate sulfurtransferase
MTTTVHTTLITPGELAALLADRPPIVIDVSFDLADTDSGERRYRESHLPGAHYLHLDRELSSAKTGRNGRHPLPGRAAFARTIGALGVTPETQVVCYDAQGGVYAARLWWMLRWLGHDAVAVLDGGYAKWVREGRPVTTEVPTVRPATFALRRVGPFLSADDVLANLEGHRITLIDARGAERYRGDVEPLDPVAGHIPGAINRPYTQNVEADGTFKSPEKLHAEFAALTGNSPPATIVNYCGSGVSACHNLLAMEIAGIRGSMLYPGSWSEWCADPARPVARGPA